MLPTMSVELTDSQSAAVAKNPDGRVKLADIEAAIANVYYLNGDNARLHGQIEPNHDGLAFGFPYNPLALLTICFVVMKNGLVVIGKSAPPVPADLGKKFSYEDAIRQLWPPMTFARPSAVVI